MSVLFLTDASTCQACNETLSSQKPGASVDGYVVHAKCFKCKECGGPLDFKAFYDLDGQPFCKECYESKVSVCHICKRPVLGGMIKTKDSPLTFHPECFNCVVCQESLVSTRFKSMGEKVFCAEDYNKRYAPRCAQCGLYIAATATERMVKRFTVLEKSYHGSCFKCEDCETLLSETSQDCFPLHGKLLCENCGSLRVSGAARSVGRGTAPRGGGS